MEGVAVLKENTDLRVIVARSKYKNEISILPSENKGAEYIIPIERLDALYKSHLIICDQISHKIANKYIELFGCTYSQAIHVIRHTLTPIMLLLLDRIYRVNSAVELNKFSLSVYKTVKYKGPYTEHEVTNFSLWNEDFNNYLIFKLGEVWSLPVINNNEINNNNNIVGKKVVSHTNRIYSKLSFSSIIVRVNMLLSKIISVFENKSDRIPVLALRRNELPLIKYGFYLKYISKVKFKNN